MAQKKITADQLVQTDLSIAGSQITGDISGDADNVTGVVAIANGGTGQTTANDALNALLPSQASQTGKVLQTDGTNVSWQAAGGGGSVTSVALDSPGGTVSITGSPITAAGTIDIDVDETALDLANIGGDIDLTTQVTGALPITNGGTGATDATTALTNLGAYPASNPSGFTTNTGTVTSVGISSAGGTVTVTGSPVTGSGSIDVAVNQAALDLASIGGDIDLSTQVTGTLGIGNGGTGQTTASAALNALLPSQTSQSGKYLQTDGTNASWQTAVSSVAWGGITGTLSSQTDLQTALNDKVDEANGNISGSFTMATNTELTGDLSTLTTAPSFKSNTGTVTHVILEAPSSAQNNSFSRLVLNGTNDLLNASYIQIQGRGDQTATSSPSILWAKRSSGAFIDQDIPLAFQVVNSTGITTTVATIHESGTPTDSTDLTTKTYVDTAVGGVLPSQTGNNGKVLGTDGTTASWVTAGSGGSPLTTKGDLFTYDTADARLPVGTNGQVLTADSAEATGLKWATPSGGGGSPGGSPNEIQFNSAGSFGGTARTLADSNGNLIVTGASTNATPSSGVALVANAIDNAALLATTNAYSRSLFIQNSIGQRNFFKFNPAGNSSTSAWQVGGNISTTGTATAISIGNTFAQQNPLISYRTSGSANTRAGLTGGTDVRRFFVSKTANIGGLTFIARWASEYAGAAPTAQRCFIGLASENGTTLPSLSSNFQSSDQGLFGVGCNAGQSDYHIVCNQDAGSTPTLTSLGSNFPVISGSNAPTDLYELVIMVKPGTCEFYYRFTRLNTGDVASGMVSSNVPAAGNETAVKPVMLAGTGTGTTAWGIAIAGLYVEGGV